MITRLDGDVTLIALAPHDPMIRVVLAEAMQHIVWLHVDLALAEQGLDGEDAAWLTIVDDLLIAISDLTDDSDHAFAAGCVREALDEIAIRHELTTHQFAHDCISGMNISGSRIH